MRNAVLAFGLALFAAACVPTCGVESLPSPQTADAGADGGGGGEDAGVDAGTVPGPDAGADAGTDGGPTACAPADAGCGATAECCSNRCPSGFCGALCVADGQPCAKATDCCSLSCNGICGAGGLCKQDGQDCPTGTNLECCSNNCVGNRCVADKTGCHPAGERCSGGGFAVDGCCGGAACINPGQATAHCDLPPDICRDVGVPCSAADQCCNNSCIAGACKSPSP